MEIFDTVLITYAIIITILSIYLYKVYGIEKVENLTNIISIIATMGVFLVGIFVKNDNGERMPFWMIILWMAMSLCPVFFTKESYHKSMDELNLRTKLSFAYKKETPLGYFLFHLFFLMTNGFIGSATILLIMGCILDALLGEGNW